MQAHEHAARAESLVGQEVGSGLRLERLICVGDLMTVYAAESPTRGRLVVKVLHPELARSIGGELSPALRLANELSHPRSPAVAEELAVANTIGIVTAHVAGESLRDLLRRRRSLPPAEALRVAAEALDVVATAHARGLGHGAISLSHVFVADDGKVHVIGFGEGRLRRKAKVARPAAFTAPEIRHSPELETALADLWSVGAVAFAMLTGRSPNGSPLDDTSPLTMSPVSLAQVVPRAPEALVSVIDRAVAEDPSLRYPDAPALRAALQTVAESPEMLLAPPLTSTLTTSSVAPPVIEAVREMQRTAPASSTPPRPARPTSGVRRTPAVAVTPRTPSPAPAGRSARPGDHVSSRPPHPVAAKVRSEPHLDAPRAPSEPLSLQAPGNPKSMAARADTHPVVPLAVDGPSSVRRRQQADLSLGITTGDDTGTTALEELLTALDRAVRARRAPDALDAATALDDLVSTTADTLSRALGGLSCTVTADALATRMRPVWSSPGALSPAVALLHAAGVETLAFVPGLGKGELAQLVGLLASAADPTATPGSVLLALHDADFSNVVFHAPDLLAGIDPERRAALLAEERRLLALFTLDTAFQLEEAWSAAKHAPTGSSRLTDSLAQLARSLSDASGASDSAPAEEEEERSHERLVRLAATSFVGPAFEPALEAFGPILREDLEREANSQPELALDSAVRLLRAVRAPEESLLQRQRALMAVVLSAPCAAILFGSATRAEVTPKTIDRLAEILPALGPEHAVALVTSGPFVQDLQLQAKINHHLELGVTGHEGLLGQVAAQSAPELAVNIVRLLGRIDTLAARSALEALANSAELIVRLEALGLIDGVSGDRLRLQLKALIEDAPEPERIAALRAIVDADVRVAAPSVALRLRSPSLDSLSFEEKRLLFNALCLLAPHRAEKIAADVLSKSRLITTAQHEETRALAAAALGGIGSSEDSVEILAEFARHRWNSSDAVREAAEHALAQVKARMEMQRLQPHSRPPTARSQRPGAPSQWPAAPSHRPAAPSARPAAPSRHPLSSRPPRSGDPGKGGASR